MTHAHERTEEHIFLHVQNQIISALRFDFEAVTNNCSLFELDLMRSWLKSSRSSHEYKCQALVLMSCPVIHRFLIKLVFERSSLPEPSHKMNSLNISVECTGTRKLLYQYLKTPCCNAMVTIFIAKIGLQHSRRSPQLNHIACSRVGEQIKPIALSVQIESPLERAC